jgi:molybdopterin-guanine dinucleotide biosynthesis protein A
MPDLSRIAGVVLAGGASSRMGQSKALLDYKGRPLVRHMMNLLAATGLTDICVSGALPGYPCIEDESALSGPAHGIKSVLAKKPGYEGYLFVPVDMPLLSAVLLRLLLDREGSAHFDGHPLPLYLTLPFKTDKSDSVWGFLKAQGASPVALPAALHAAMQNANTPEEWEEIVSAP